LFSVPVFGDYSYTFGTWSQTFGGFSDPNTGLAMFPTLDIPPGGRYEGMGTAYTAVSNDTALLEANPAGSRDLEGAELSFFHHNWIADSAIESLALVSRIGRFGFGFGGKFFYNAFTEYDESGQRAAKGYFSETSITANGSFRIISVPKVASLSVGANVKALFRLVPEVFAQNQSAFDVALDLGLLGRFHLLDLSGSQDTNLSVGAVIKNVGPKVYHLGYPLPLKLSFGLAYSPLRVVTVAADLNVPISFDAEFPAEAIDFAVGLNVDVTSFLSLYGGMHFRADNPKFSLEARCPLAG
jgi:hypothetical protein